MSDNNVHDYYNARAAEYEQIYYRDDPVRRKEIDDEVERLKTLVTGRSVLELACGTGYWTRAMSAAAREIVAIDISAEMLSEARRKSYTGRVEFVQGDMFQYDFGRRFEVLVVGFWFSHQPKQEYRHLFDLIRKLTTDGGRIWLIDNNPVTEGPQNVSAGVDEHGNNYKRRFLDNGKEFVILKNYFTEEELYEVFSPEFDVESIVYKTYYWSAVLRKR